MNDDDKKPENENQAAQGESLESMENLEALAGEYQPAADSGPQKARQESQDKAKEKLAAQIAGLNLMLFEGVAALRGDHWKLKQAEAEVLAQAEVECLPNDLDDLPPWVGLCMVAGMIVLPRLATDRALSAANDDDSKGGKDAA